MTQQHREKLNFIAGRLEGIAYGVDNENLCDAIMKCSEDIDRILSEESSKPTVMPAIESDNVYACAGCKYEDLSSEEYPCDECWNGNGRDRRVIHWEEDAHA